METKINEYWNQLSSIKHWSISLTDFGEPGRGASDFRGIVRAIRRTAPGETPVRLAIVAFSKSREASISRTWTICAGVGNVFLSFM